LIVVNSPFAVHALVGDDDFVILVSLLFVDNCADASKCECRKETIANAARLDHTQRGWKTDEVLFIAF
jgi:hypothetical protein